MPDDILNTKQKIQIYRKALELMALELWCVSQTPYRQEWEDMKTEDIVQHFVDDAIGQLEKQGYSES